MISTMSKRHVFPFHHHVVQKDFSSVLLPCLYKTKKGVKGMLKVMQGVKENSQEIEELLIFSSDPLVSLLSLVLSLSLSLF